MEDFNDNAVKATSFCVNSYNIKHDLMRRNMFNETYYYNYKLFIESEKQLIELYGFSKYIDLIYIVNLNTRI
jgi:hypothetical protein